MSVVPTVVVSDGASVLLTVVSIAISLVIGAVVGAALWIGRVFWKKGDGATIDGLGPDGIAARANDIAGVLSRFQSGYLYHYAFVMLIGVAALVSYFMLFVR